MSKLTREENVQAVFDLKAGYTLGLADIEIIKRVARMALAAMDSEPVVFTDERNLHHIVMGRETSLIWGKQNQEAGDIPLYRHAQQPVVLDDLLSMAASAIEDLLEHTDPNTSYYSGVWADVPGKLRAAMLQAGNSPVIPEGYVLVPIEPTSEMVKKMRYHAGSYDRNIKDGYKAMLSAAPQEVKGE